jgi:hypothetical protein
VRKVEEIKKCSHLWTELSGFRREIDSYSRFGGIKEYTGKLQSDRSGGQTLLDKLQELKEQWLKEIRSESFFTKLLAVLGVKSVKKKREVRFRMILSNCPVPADNLDYGSPSRIELFIVEHIRLCKQKLDDTEKEIDTVNLLIGNHTAAETRWESWKSLHNIQSDPPGSIDALDTGLRHDAFQLAIHYWEGRWLMGMDEFFSDDLKRKNKLNMEAKWRRYAMLTPCFVSTFFMLPKYFRYYAPNRDRTDVISLPLFEFIDLLMVDEAGQVPAEIGGASFALAKKAIVVGDIKQIEPVRNTMYKVDIGNMHRNGLIENWEDEVNISRLHDAGISAFEGSVMKIAQTNSTYLLDGHEERGMFLAEHRRCYNEIIAYCNRLAYKGKLIPLRGSPGPDEQLFPPIGYANIASQSQRHYGSLKNPLEAQGIARWLKENKEKIENKYGTVQDAVGIITPFAAQRWELIHALREVNIASQGMKIGTIHALQGAERPIILFSPVYGYDDSRALRFINRQINMLNVAVSRSKDSFLVFGNMCIFNPEESTPSGILANFLFADEKNELSGIRPQKREGDVERIDEINRFRFVLKKSIEKAVSSVMIVSPFISINAIREDKLAPVLKNAVSRGVKIKVYTDKHLDFLYDKLKFSAAEGREILKQCGVELIVVQGIHNKTLCVDDRYLAEGSFNWLSSPRKPEHPYFRYNVSFGYKGKKVAEYIRQAITQMDIIARKGGT